MGEIMYAYILLRTKKLRDDLEEVGHVRVCLRVRALYFAMLSVGVGPHRWASFGADTSWTREY
jgi:hypothetical protein